MTRQGSRNRGRRRGVLALAAALFAAAPSSASAVESAMPTVQARAVNAEWVPYLDPPPKPAAICLVDSGVDVTPDTPATSPDGPIIARESLDGGTGESGGGSPHGTYMAMTAGAPVNDWGTVGLWPGVRIYSVRARPVDATEFPFDDYRRAIGICRTQAAKFNIVAVNLSLGCGCFPPPEEQERLTDAVNRAHAYFNLSVVASAGNDGGSPGSPANTGGVLSVGGSDPGTGALCAFSNRGPSLDLIAPGCGLEGADATSGAPFRDWAGGTSASAAQAVAAVALLRSYRPDLGWKAAEDLVRASSVVLPDGPRLDVGSLFRAAGLGHLVDEARARAPQAEPLLGSDPDGKRDTPYLQDAPPSLAELAAGRIRNQTGLTSGLPAPKLRRVVRFGRRLILSVRNRPARARLLVEVQRRQGEFGHVTVARKLLVADTLVVWLPRRSRAARIVVRYERVGRSRRVSPTVYRRIAR